MKKTICILVGLLAGIQPVTAQQVANRVNVLDGNHANPGILIPAGVGAGVIIHQQINSQPMPMLVDPEDPEGSLSIPDNGGFFANNEIEANKRCRERGFREAKPSRYMYGGQSYICIK